MYFAEQTFSTVPYDHNSSYMFYHIAFECIVSLTMNQHLFLQWLGTDKPLLKPMLTQMYDTVTYHLAAMD